MGGAERVLVDLIEALKDDYEHEVIFFHEGSHKATLERLGVPCRRVTGLVCLYDPLFWLRFVRAIRQAQSDCIHSLLWGANWASCLVGPLLHVPVVSGLHNYLDGYGKVRRVLDRLVFRPNCFVAVSSGVAESYGRVYKSVKPAKVCVIDDGINVPPNESRSRISRDSLSIPEEASVIGTVGRFEPEKNQQLLVSAFSQFVTHSRERGFTRELFLVMVGYGSLESALREQVVLLGLEKQVLFVVGQQADDYYALFDCFVLTSPSEGLSLALLEAMVRSIPCVVTNNEAHHPALTSGQNGVVVATYDEIALSTALLEVLCDKKAACRMGSEAKKTVLEHYTVDRMARSYRDLFNSCMKK